MQKKSKTLLIVIGIIVVSGIIIGTILRINSVKAESKKRPQLTVNVVLGKPSRGEMVLIESLTGNIMPIQQANIFPKVSGNIERVYVDIGRNVSAGQVLALIDTTIYSQNVKQAKANYNQTQANVDNTKLTYERNQTLLDQNLISRQEVDNSRTAYNVAQAQRDAAYATYTNALTQLSYCRIKAPFAGIITKRYFDIGNYVNAGSATANLFTLMDLSKLKAIINLPEKDVQLLPKIQDIQITADAVPGRIFHGKMATTSQAVDLATRTMQVEIDMDNPEKILKPGMFVTINIILDKKENALILPNNVVLNDQNGNFVYITAPDSTVHKKYIQTGIQQNNKYEITGGLSDDEKVVFTGQNLVKDGSKVRILR